MERLIKISGKVYKMKASALTQFLYKNDTGRSFLSDIKKLNKLNSKELTEEDTIDSFDDVNELILKVAYTMIKQGDNTQVTNYEEFLDSIDDLYSEPDWIAEVIELACSPISRQLQEN